MNCIQRELSHKTVLIQSSYRYFSVVYALSIFICRQKFLFWRSFKLGICIWRRCTKYLTDHATNLDIIFWLLLVTFHYKRLRRKKWQWKKIIMCMKNWFVVVSCRFSWSLPPYFTRVPCIPAVISSLCFLSVCKLNCCGLWSCYQLLI